MNDVRYNTITAEEAGQRLDNYLIRILKGVPKSFIYRIIRSGEVRINKKRAHASTRLISGDHIRLPPVRTAESKDITVGPAFIDHIKHCILFEDNSLLVINKPTGIAVHGGSGVSLGLVEALRKMRPDLPYLELIHRLDKETSGCLLFAKKRSTLRGIQALLAKREVTKIYWALLAHPWEKPINYFVDAPLEKFLLKSGERRVKINPHGKASQTAFKLLENYTQACLVEICPKTGRTHQIRVHSAFLGCPIAGDEKYGESLPSKFAKDSKVQGDTAQRARVYEDVSNDSVPLVSSVFGKKPNESLKDRLLKSRLYLHAHCIQFNLNGKQYRFEAHLDKQFTAALEMLRKDNQ